LEAHRKRLRRMVRLHLDPRLQGRVDPSDVLQEAYLEAAERLTEYLRDPKLPFFLWLRFLTGQKLLALRRRYLGTQARDAARELSIYQGAMPETIPVLERSLQESKRQRDSFDLFFLAMCHHRLGDEAKARDCRERGARWLWKYKGQLTASWAWELSEFQAEADAVLAQPPGPPNQ
jgi:hypothetical protein